MAVLVVKEGFLNDEFPHHNTIVANNVFKVGDYTVVANPRGVNNGAHCGNREIDLSLGKVVTLKNGKERVTLACI